MYKYWRPITLLISLLGLVACGGTVAPATIPAVPTLAESAGGGGETAVAQATPTLNTTATLPLPPTMAPVDVAPTSSPTTAPVADTGPLDAGEFGPDRNPLTGELVTDPAVLQRRPLAVKLSNAPAMYVRPQSGLNDADWVFEHTTEGAVTRFTAIFYGKTPAKIGPVRSARLIDLELPAMFDAGLVFSGASAGVRQRLYSSDFANRINEGGFGLYRSGEDKPLEHTMYGNPIELWQELTAKGQNTPPQFGTFLTFSEQPPAGGTSVSHITIDYESTLVEWRYDSDTGRYLRWADNEIHTDGNTGEQVRAANVVVLSPYHLEEPTICEEIRDGVCAHLSVQIQLWGSGTGFVLRDGQQFEVAWHRDGRYDLLTFTDPSGNPFPLQVGNTWVQVIPSWLVNPVTTES